MRLDSFFGQKINLGMSGTVIVLFSLEFHFDRVMCSMLMAVHIPHRFWYGCVVHPLIDEVIQKTYIKIGNLFDIRQLQYSL